MSSNKEESGTKLETGTYSIRENQRFAKFIFDNTTEYKSKVELCREAANAVKNRSGDLLAQRYSRILKSVQIVETKLLLNAEEKLKVANEYILDKKWMADRGFVENDNEEYQQAEGESSSTAHDTENNCKQSIKKEDLESDPSIDDQIEETWKKLKNLMFEKTSQLVDDRVRKMEEQLERLQPKKELE